ncbi:conserved hypothetical protein [Burkholderia cenocepacia]|uniref:hypothetical protein n=1 Tax=Burkholderia cenocepacia TaxID=95486 RepID=UPI00192C1553|nr:hypothetical protein [Burkholderia cenocepacia]CAD9227857.1 conserved hypothetical protein [Burkholderia cenocepacia]
MFILATHCKYKNYLQQFYGDNLVNVINKAKEFGDPDEKISVFQKGDFLVFEVEGLEQEKFNINEGNYLANICNFMNNISSAVNDGCPSQYVIFDTDNPDQGYRGSGGKVEGLSLAALRARANQHTRNVKYTIKSAKCDERGVWLAHPPKFLSIEGCFSVYERGESVDEWLVDPNDLYEKTKFLAKLNKKTGKEPTQEQLGIISLQEVHEAGLGPLSRRQNTKQ